MPKHTRNASGSNSRYSSHIPVSLAPSPMYSQQRLSIPENYYNVPSSSAANAMPLQQQQQSYDPYPQGVAPPVSMPTSHRASSGAWAPHEDQQLLAARMQGLNWGQIKETYFPSKTPNACRKRHERLMERKGSDDWDQRKLQRLAKEYMGMRKEIWSGLAARTGEKWGVVEQKVLSNGFKNLQSASRAASRRDRLEAGGSLQGYDDDSGISGIGLTPVDELDASYSSPETSPSHAHSGSASYHLQPHAHGHAHAHAHLQPLAVGPVSYSMGGYGGSYATHGYSSSQSGESSNGSVGHNGYAPHNGNGHSQGGSPYMTGQRLPSVDMGIDAIMNRPRGGGM